MKMKVGTARPDSRSYDQGEVIQGALNMTRATKTLLGTAIGAVAMALSGASASADVVCSGNTCWHVKDKYTYPAESQVIVREDTWKPGPAIKFREREGRGYWKGDAWVDF
jgi:hypothetical protein